MKITIESTDKIVELVGNDGGALCPARLWEGETDDGVPVFCFVTRIAPAIPEAELPGEIARRFGRALMETRAPSAVVAAFPARLIL